MPIIGYKYGPLKYQSAKAKFTIGTLICESAEEEIVEQPSSTHKVSIIIQRIVSIIFWYLKNNNYDNLKNSKDNNSKNRLQNLKDKVWHREEISCLLSKGNKANHPKFERTNRKNTKSKFFLKSVQNWCAQLTWKLNEANSSKI